ncbi:unnamed protein product [Moneuplotes crassus]|uniref:Katanin p60 ATPase-containing subunit A1 n=1 Tax=Euplotes crassus TaxID=5936 RepID=A0AAD1X606_EUPCR|nr:unnamed protein product [Moneuplotes crassus]
MNLNQKVNEISDVPKLIRLCREKACLGLYEDSSIRFTAALKIIKQHCKTLTDYYILNRWKTAEKSIQEERKLVNKLAETTNKSKEQSKHQDERPIQSACSEIKHINLRKIANLECKSNIKTKADISDEQKRIIVAPADISRFGGLMPFEHHQIPHEYIQYNEKGNIINPSDLMNQDLQKNKKDFDPDIDAYSESCSSEHSGRGGKQPAQQKKPKMQLPKDPDVWDPPDPLPQKNQKVRQTAGRRNERQNRPANFFKNAPSPKSNIKRKYEKPWIVPPKKEKKKAKSYLEYVYPDEEGPDADLIKSLEKEVILRNPNVSFDDIADLDDAKRVLEEAVVYPLMMPKFFRGIRRPSKGVCLFGPPGTGKTMLAKAIATLGETTFISISAAALSTKWRGESERLVRILFDIARFYAPTTIFIDEIDSLASKRGNGEHESSRKVKTEFFIQMDGVTSGTTSEYLEESKDSPSKNIMVLAATNRPWDLDEAIIRRLEKRVYIPLPKEKGRKALFDLNLKNIGLSDDIDWDILVDKTKGYSGADINNLCRDAALMPMRRILTQGRFNVKEVISMQDQFEEPLSMKDFLDALSNVNPSVGDEYLEKYAKWAFEFGST